MVQYFKTRRSIFFNVALLFLLALVWCVSYMHPVLRSFWKEEHLFYGTVSYAAIPSVFGGTDIPFLDKTYFQINGDENATFVLYASETLMDEMSDWFSFAAKNAGEIPLEISAVRLDGNKYIVKSLASTYGELDWETISEYQLYYSLIGLGVVVVCALGFVTFVVLGIRSRR